jgi:protein ImuB
MGKRFVSIWFRHLATDWFSLRQPELKKLPFVLRMMSHGRMIITSSNATAEQLGIHTGMVLADARAIYPQLHVVDDIANLPERLLKKLAEWSIRFTPVVCVDLPDGLMFDATGCSHLWGGEPGYISHISKKLSERGYDARIAMADTQVLAWGLARYGKGPLIIPPGESLQALLALPPEALKIDHVHVAKLHKLGLKTIKQFIHLPRPSLRRRFGEQFLVQLDKAIGKHIETIIPVIPPTEYLERLPCMEPITTATGIEIALKELLIMLCTRLKCEQKGLRKSIFKGYRIDGKVVQIDIATNKPSHHAEHLFKLFEVRLPLIEPDPGIELFTLEASIVNDHLPVQEIMWDEKGGLEDVRVSELLDRISNKIGSSNIRRYLPAEHHWPERAFVLASSVSAKPSTSWPQFTTRPLQLLYYPERIEVTAPIPDYPPMLFIHKGKIHHIVKADGPERIEQEWWIQQGEHRDYYRVEDEAGQRYWLFRLGHYNEKKFEWFLHGYFH